MDNCYDVVLKLIKNVFWGTDIKEKENSNWDEIDSIVEKHKIGSILASIEQKTIIPKAIRNKWTAVAAYQIMNNHRLLRDQDIMLKVLANASIPVVILKGVAASQYYPHPELRPMGDVDFIVPREKYEDAYNLLLNNGFSIVGKPDRHIELEHNGISYELHRFFTISNDSKYAQKLDDVIIQNIEKSHVINVEGYYIPVLPPLINGLVLLQHINQHLEKGLGLRQIVDWVLFFSNVIVSVEIWDEFHEYILQIGLEQLEYYITSMCVYYLGLTSPKDVYDADIDVCNELLQYILSSGNFGYAQRKSVTDKKVTTVLERNKSLLQRIRIMSRNGNVHWLDTHKHGLLPPFAFFYQIGYYVKEMMKHGISINQIGTVVQQYNKKLALLEKIGAKIKSKGYAVYKNGKFEK